MKKIINIIILVVFSFVSFNANVIMNNDSVAQAATNLVKGGGFETMIESDWGLWYEGISPAETVKKYQMYRSYEPAFGNGSYSVAIEAFSEPRTLFSASISMLPQNAFPVEANKEYYLIYYSKAKQATEIAATLLETDVYAPVAEIKTDIVATEWQKKFVFLKPTKSANVQLGFSFGNMANGNVINIDGVQIIEAQNSVLTTEVKGKIGDRDKYIKINDISYLDKNDIQIELPYFDALTGLMIEKRFNPTKVSGTSVYFDFTKGTFSGIAKVYVRESLVGNFNYNVSLAITEVNPSLARADEDLVIYGSGFNPKPGNTFVIFKQKDKEGHLFDKWMEPAGMDSALSQLNVKMPLGIVSGELYIYTSFWGNQNLDVKNLSNKIKYKVKPIIYDVKWNQKGYEQVGDKLIVYGKGVIDNPSINFYNEAGVKIDAVKAKVSEISDKEVIEFISTKKANKFMMTVVSGGIESDKIDALNYSAKPRIISVTAKKSRIIAGSADKVSAAKVGEVIKIKSEGLLNIGSSTVAVEFSGYNGNVNVEIASTQIDKYGYISVVVPEGAQNGYVAVIANGEKSNYLPLEIIPTIIEIVPEVVVPGEVITITADGVGLNSNLTKIYFNLGNNQQEVVTADSNEVVQNKTIIKATAPMMLPGKVSSIKIQYDNWMNDSIVGLKINPTINRARIDMDTKILTIEGYGFSILPKENKVIYKYADEARTVINPNVKILGVYPTEQGQEMKIQINDDYHYGYVSVEVGGLVSNEMNFGPMDIKRIARRVEYVKSVDKVMGVLYISGNNFGEGDVKVGDVWAQTHYRSNYLIIAVVEKEDVYKDPVLITKK